jgi:DNA-nicking Smr family endonuclease
VVEGAPLSIVELLSAIPEASIDLHGLSARQAERRVIGFVEGRARSSPGAVVEIVTGKGTRSEGRAVLPGLVRELLEGPLSSLVSEWAGAVGGGAVRVQIRRGRSPRGPSGR